MLEDNFRRLISLAQEGDRLAQEQLIQLIVAALTPSARKGAVGSTPLRVSDVLQSVTGRLLKQLKNGTVRAESVAELQGLGFRILRTVLRDHRSHARKAQGEVLEEIDERNVDPDWMRRVLRPDELAHIRDLVSRILDCAASLPEPDRMQFHLLTWRGMSHKEAALALGLASADQSRGRWQRVKADVRKRLGLPEEESPGDE